MSSVSSAYKRWSGACSKTIRTARSRSSGEYLLGRAMGSILSRNEPSDKPGTVQHRRTSGSSSEDGEFVPKHDDFQFLEIVRPIAQSSELQNPPKHHVTKGKEHEVQRRRTTALFYASACLRPVGTVRTAHKT